jgi:hypothetical protein
MHAHGDGITEELHETGLAGNADLWGIDLVYKYDGTGAYGQGDITFQTEYLRSIKDMKIAPARIRSRSAAAAPSPPTASTPRPPTASCRSGRPGCATTCSA